MKLGIDMGGMSIKMGLVNEENKIIGRITIPTDLTVPYQTLVERMADAVRQMLENAGMTLEQCGDWNRKSGNDRCKAGSDPVF